MNEETIFWLWLSRTLGAGAALSDLICCFGSVQKLYEAGRREWRMSGLLTARQMEKLSQFSPSESGELLKLCRENRWRVLTPSDSEYPSLLLQLPDFPAALFVWGDETALELPVKLSVVGTRTASQYGVRVTELLTEALAKAGAVVVSGGALGIDSAAHWGAIRGGGRTIAVLGCGLGTRYLQENEALRREIAGHGAVVTEFLPFTPASRTTFPIRNRIISGLSLGTVVVEAGERSGSLITARLALEQGRDVFAVPGDVISSAFTGTNRLLRDGAKPVFTALDVLEEYVYTYPEQLDLTDAALPLGAYARKTAATLTPLPREKSVRRVKKSAAAEKSAPEEVPAPPGALPRNLTANARAVYASFGKEAAHIDELSERAGLPTPQTLAALTELELYSLVGLSEGKQYRKI